MDKFKDHLSIRAKEKVDLRTIIVNKRLVDEIHERPELRAMLLSDVMNYEQFKKNL